MTGATRKQPLRRCIMCRRSDPKNELLRFVASVQGITWDSAHRLPGRGAYIHRSVSCWVKAGERTRWEHAFRGATGITQEGLQALQERIRAEVPELGAAPVEGRSALTTKGKVDKRKRFLGV